MHMKLLRLGQRAVFLRNALVSSRFTVKPSRSVIFNHIAKSNFSVITPTTDGLIDTSATGKVESRKFTNHEEYHGSEHAESNVLLNRLFEATLEQVPAYGWTHEAVQNACELHDIPIGLKSLLMPNGPFDLVSRFVSTSNASLSAQMAEWRKDSLEMCSDSHPRSYKAFATAAETDAFLHRAMKASLEMLIPVKSQWPQAMVLMALPQNVPTSLGLVAELVDEVWAHAGDKSTDMNWYAKRLGLAYVHNLTEVQMLQDHSPNHQETWEFLERRIQDLRSCKQADLKSVASMLKEGVRAFGSVTNNLLGIKRH